VGAADEIADGASRDESADHVRTRRLGAHLPLARGMRKAVDRAAAIGAEALQIFSDNPTAWRRRSEPSPELAEFRARLETRDIRPIAIHASYLVNLPGPDDVTYARSVGMLSGELARAWEYGASLVNVHIGSHRGSGVDVGIARLVDGIEAALSSAREQAIEPGIHPARLVLENSAGGGGGLGTTVDELATIADRLGDRGIEHDAIGFCLDTAHAWGAGVDMADPDAIDSFLAAFDRRIGVDRIVLLHLNDTRSERGSRTDRHEHLGAGRIGPDGLGHVIRHPLLAHAPAIIETPGMDVGYDRVNLARAPAMLHGKQLRPLPRAAFDLAGSARGRGAARVRPATRERGAAAPRGVAGDRDDATCRVGGRAATR
jgi:deoxyribonuclease-4